MKEKMALEVDPLVRIEVSFARSHGNIVIRQSIKARLVCSIPDHALFSEKNFGNALYFNTSRFPPVRSSCR